MDVREKLEVIAHLGDHITYREDTGICYDSALAKVIEDAYMTLKNGVTVHEWISVKDRLPDNGKMAICDTLYFTEVLQWDERASVWVGKHSIHSQGYVTHWMPLPQPPKGE